jgi:hypothetical protein
MEIWHEVGKGFLGRSIWRGRQSVLLRASLRILEVQRPFMLDLFPSTGEGKKIGLLYESAGNAMLSIRRVLFTLAATARIICRSTTSTLRSVIGSTAAT